MPQKSAPYQLIEIMYNNANRGNGHSWTRLNGSLRQQLSLAITAGMAFAAKDIEEIYNDFKGGYWLTNPEGLYAVALDMRSPNLSAAAAFETYFVRPRYVVAGTPLHVGSTFHWVSEDEGGEVFAVTSFAADGLALVACAYHPRPSGSHTTAKIKRRVTLPHTEFVAREKARTKAIREAKKAEKKEPADAEST